MKCPICGVKMEYNSDRLDGHILLEEHYICKNCNKYNESYEYGHSVVCVGNKQFYWYYSYDGEKINKVNRKISSSIKFQKLLWRFKKWLKI